MHDMYMFNHELLQDTGGFLQFLLGSSRGLVACECDPPRIGTNGQRVLQAVGTETV